MKKYIESLIDLFIETWATFKNLPEIISMWLDGFLDTDLGVGDYENEEESTHVAFWSGKWYSNLGDGEYGEKES